MIQLHEYEPHKSSRGGVISTPRLDTRKVRFLMQRHSTRIPSFPENLNDYAPWVATHGLTAPYGECQCGCGNKAAIATTSSRKYGWVKGWPVRYLNHHHHGSLTCADALWGLIKPGLSDSCWEWCGNLDRHGYGYFKFKRKHRKAHRVSWEIHYGPIPEGLGVLHRCDNPSCCNPNHLFLGTHQDNMDDMIAKGRGVIPPGFYAEGESNPGARFTNAQVRELRRLFVERKTSITAFAKLHQVSFLTMRKIINHVSYRNA